MSEQVKKPKPKQVAIQPDVYFKLKKHLVDLRIKEDKPIYMQDWVADAVLTKMKEDGKA